MAKLLSTKYTTGAFNTALLFMRLVFGILIMHHGYVKLINFEGTAKFMPEFFGTGQHVSAALVIFSELLCGFLLVIGLFTRIALIPLIISTSVALFKAHHGHVFAEGELATLYLGAFVAILIVGPGKASIDGLIGK